jgi:hypothetical protein
MNTITGSNAFPDSVSSSDSSSDKRDLSDERSSFKKGDKVEVLTRNGWRRGTYKSPVSGTHTMFLSISTGKLDEAHWITIRGGQVKAALSDIRAINTDRSHD